MSGRPRSVKQAQVLHAAQLREQGHSWAQVGAAFQLTYRVNPRVALRQAHGWSQPQAAERWTARWPADPKTFKNFSYWEQWPGATGHAPSLDTLDRLAQLYECKITDLLSDCDDYGASQVRPARPATGRLWPSLRGSREFEPAGGPSLGLLRRRAAGPGQDSRPSETLRAALETIRRAELGELLTGAGAADAPDRRLRRRTLLLEASSALAVVAAAPMLEVPRLTGGRSSHAAQADLAVVDYAADVVAGLRRLGGAVGPRITLPPAMALRAAMAALARTSPSLVNSRALTAYGDLTQLVGWLMFNLGDHKAARYYYDDARSAAYRAANPDLIAYTLAASSHLAVTQGQERYAIDHAQAAQQAARAGGTPYAHAYAADVLARAYAACGQVARCYRALDKERTALDQIEEETPQASWWYFYDKSFYWGTESECKVRLNQDVDATDAAERSLGLVAPMNLHNSALTLAFQAESLIKQGDIEEGCLVLADAARLTTLNSSERISGRVKEIREHLHDARDTAAVRELDERLAEYRRTREAGEPAESVPI